MKHVLLLLLTAILMISCGQQPEVRTISLDEKERAHCIEVLRLYQNVDSQLIDEKNRVYQLMLKYSIPGGEPSEAEKDYFLHNVVHIDSVMSMGISLVAESKYDELLALLETEINNIYGHPHHTIDNELLLHDVMMLLYFKKYPHIESLAKSIPLLEWTMIRMETSSDRHPMYVQILMEILAYYDILEKQTEVISVGQKLSSYAIQAGDEKAQIYSSLLMEHSYNMEGMQELGDSCCNSVKHLLDKYPEVYETTMQFLNR